jgi:hypothetical protein
MPNPVFSPCPPRGLILLAGIIATGLLRGADPIQEVGKTATEWVKTRAETVRIENAWVQDRALLSSTLNGLKERADRLQEKRDYLLAATADERAEQAALAAKLADAKEKLQLTETQLQTLTEKILRLRTQLPPRLRDALEMSYRSLAGKEGSPGERTQIMMTVLNRCAQFNLAISHGEEVLALPGESAPKSVDVIYWGLSHGYALDRAGNKAWLGTPAPEGWRWEALDAGAPAVAELIAIRRDEADPRLVLVPARLKGTP